MKFLLFPLLVGTEVHNQSVFIKSVLGHAFYNHREVFPSPNINNLENHYWLWQGKQLIAFFTYGINYPLKFKWGNRYVQPQSQ